MNMIRLSIYLISLLLLGCSEGKEQRLYKDPITGEETVFNYLVKDGWGIYTALDGKVLILEKDGKSLVYVIDAEPFREINIASTSNSFGAVNIVDRNYDNQYDTIVYRNKDIEVTDVGLDGRIEGILNYKEKTMLVNYNGKLTKLLGEGKKKYVVVDDKKIYMKYSDGVFVPVGE